MVVTARLLSRRRPLAGLGIAWFLAAHALTATFVPLELVYEHRNYFASLGLMLTFADIVSIGTRSFALFLLPVMFFFQASTTYLRAREWSDPLTFATTSAAKHPLSPRATYQLGQTYVILSNGDPKSPMTSKAFTALEVAREVPNSGVLPVQGLLMLASRTGRPIQRAWWEEFSAKLRDRPIGPQETSALAAMTDCAIALRCPFPQGRMIELYLAALHSGEHAEVMNIYGNYALNVLHDHQLTRRLWLRAIQLSPNIVQYRVNLIRFLIAQGQFTEARQGIEALRRMGRLGQNQATAASLENMIPDTLVRQDGT
jgi:hypothetical protein